MRKLALLAILTLAAPSIAFSEDTNSQPELILFDDRAILNFCDGAIVKQFPNINPSDLQIHTIWNERGFDGKPATTVVEFILAGTRKVEKNEKDGTWTASYEIVKVILDPDGEVPEKSKLSKFRRGYAHKTEPEQ